METWCCHKTASIYTAAGQTDLTIHSGDGTASGGTITLRGGNAGPATGGTGGDLTLQAGGNMPQGGAGYSNLGAAGSVYIYSGSGYNTAGGNIIIQAGSTSCWALTGGAHADVTISGGATNYSAADPASIVFQGGATSGGCSGNSNGGNLVLKPGVGGGSGSQGTIQLQGNFSLGSNGTALASIIKSSVTVDVTSVAANSTLLQTFTVANATITASVTVSPSATLPNGLIIAYARVSAANTVEVKFTNTTGLAIDPASMAYYITVIQ
jgi:hypothetical protein